nr:MAG TPA: hypothetical protein [Caudoviricetes sp.]
MLNSDFENFNREHNYYLNSYFVPYFLRYI